MSKRKRMLKYIGPYPFLDTNYGRLKQGEKVEVSFDDAIQLLKARTKKTKPDDPGKPLFEEVFVMESVPVHTGVVEESTKKMVVKTRKKGRR